MLGNAQRLLENLWTILNNNLDGYKKYIAMQLGVIYESQMTNRKQGGLLLRALLPHCTPIGCLVVIYDFKLAERHKNTIKNKWKL
jgi:hypothetical protein